MRFKNYPIDAKNNPEVYGFWNGWIFGLIQASLYIASNSIEASKLYFRSEFSKTIPKSEKSLNLLNSSDYFANLDNEKIWEAYKRLLTLYLDLEGEDAFGSSISVSEKEFKNKLLLSEKKILNIFNL